MVSDRTPWRSETACKRGRSVRPIGLLRSERARRAQQRRSPSAESASHDNRGLPAWNTAICSAATRRIPERNSQHNPRPLNSAVNASGCFQPGT